MIIWRYDCVRETCIPLDEKLFQAENVVCVRVRACLLALFLYRWKIENHGTLTAYTHTSISLHQSFSVLGNKQTIMISVLKQPLAFRLRSHSCVCMQCVSEPVSFLVLNLPADRHCCCWRCHCHRRRDKHSTFTVSKNLFAFLSTLLVFLVSWLVFFLFCHLLGWKAHVCVCLCMCCVCVWVKSFRTKYAFSLSRWYVECACDCDYGHVNVYMRPRSCFKFACMSSV